MPPPPGSRAERKRISLALLDLLCECGYGSIALDRLLSQAGVTDAAFRRHFDSLDDCFDAVWGEVDAEFEARMEAAYADGREWQDRLREALLAGLRYLAAHQGRARLYLVEPLRVSETLRQRQRAAQDRLRAMIEQGDSARGLPPGSAPIIAEAVAGGIWHRIQQLVLSGRYAELPPEVPQLMYFAVLPFLGAAAAEAELRRLV